MKYVRTTLGYAIAGIFVMSVWGAFAGKYGIAGGWFAGFAIIGSMWFLNHFLGLIDNPGAFVDMALGIGICGTMRDVFMKGTEAAVASMPTLIIVILGGMTGGIVAVMCQKDMAKKEEAKQEA
ncbi:hypothetical protein HNQ80_005032 [Anaerosolibacter carboniphilus]|uniref:Uncharacterized protein n=1 Tax=Anaerosolibacter carboniphilus TaxID=1417629 RepID=A0A841KZR9_9FIRM|nr:hypothetical protein [Anaerosolibacter carboniphilus]MBB6218857.1 hypothetical protein [Anaerosolibacter carboniphilus]